MHMFELTWVGFTIAGVLFVVAFNKWLLPDRRPAIEQFGDTREYSVEKRFSAEHARALSR
jgi:hypothetical protein